MKTLNSFAFGSASGRKSSYDWDKFLDGQIWLLEPGVDFACKANSFLMLARTMSKKRGKSLRTAIRPEGVIIQAFQDDANIEDVDVPEVEEAEVAVSVEVEAPSGQQVEEEIPLLSTDFALINKRVAKARKAK